LAYDKKLKEYSQKLGTITNNSREDFPEEEFLNTDGGVMQSMANEGLKTPDRDEQPVNLNTSVFLHSRLGLLDNQVTVNYDLTMQTQDNKKSARLSKKEKFMKQNNFKEMP